jgi:hypothetical protein
VRKQPIINKPAMAKITEKTVSYFGLLAKILFIVSENELN